MITDLDGSKKNRSPQPPTPHFVYLFNCQAEVGGLKAGRHVALEQRVVVDTLREDEAITMTERNPHIWRRDILKPD